MSHVAVIFAGIGGYHAARLKAAHDSCSSRGWRLTAVQLTNTQGEHPWGALEGELPFTIETVVPREATNLTLTPAEWRECGRRLSAVLDRIEPDAVAIPGWGYSYSRTALSWCRSRKVPAILMSESKQDDEPRRWWKEWLKAKLYVRKFRAALVGGVRHREYLVELGLPPERIFAGYDVVDNDYFAEAARRARNDPSAARGRQASIPERPYFLVVTRFVQRKNLLRLLLAYAEYLQHTAAEKAWDLVICGSGEQFPEIRERSRGPEFDHRVHLPGFLTYREIGDWYGLASAFIHPALQEQWGLVVNEAMAAGLCGLVSNRCGCYPELVREGVTGFGFNPEDAAEITGCLRRISDGSVDPSALGQSAADHMKNFRPGHFADGLLRAVTAAA